MSKKSVIMIVVLLVIGAGAAAYFLLFSPDKEPENYASVYVPGDYFITNTKNSKQMVKATVVVTVNAAPDDTAFFENMDNYQHHIRNIIVFALRSKKPDELMADDIESVLESEIVPMLNERIGMDVFNGIIISDLVVQ